MSHDNIHLISASAGSGKTYELMEQLYREISQKSASPSSIMAVTFTKKAANELISRVQQKLIQQGDSNIAFQMNAAQIGTVHSICGNLLKSFAYELGLSPELEIIDEVQASELFQEAFLEAPSLNETERLEYLTRKFQIDHEEVKSEIEDICKKIRQNNIDSQQLDKFAKQSKNQLNIFLAKKSNVEISSQLFKHLKEYQTNNEDIPDSTKKTEKAHHAVLKAARKFQLDILNWKDWLDLAKISPGKKSESKFEQIKECASQLRCSSEFRKDYEELIDISFSIAKNSMILYEEIKRNRGVMDFGDQEHKTLELLSKPSNLKKLEGEIDLFLVDEFQDSNPIQLAIFLKISEIAKKSIWVGDPKQSIYGFQGADPSLMISVINAIGTKENTKILSNNYRSSSPLVHFCSHLFSKAFTRDGIEENNVKLEPKSNIKSECDPLMVWDLSDSKADERLSAVAIRICEMIHSDQMIFDKSTKKLRKIIPADIAILVRTNSGAKSISNALMQYGVMSTVLKSDLLNAPEVSACLSGLKLAVNPEDTLAAAELGIFFGENPQDIVKKSLDDTFEYEMNAKIKKLASLEISDRTPYELLTKIVGILEIEEYLRSFQNYTQRLENINSLFTLCRKFENSTSNTQSPCTTIGFVSELETLIDSEDERDGRQSNDAISIMTYHRSKGLEWPIVLLMDLEKENWPNDQFGVRIKSNPSFDATDPLKGRSVLYLPWVFGGSPFGKRSNVDWVLEKISKNSETIALESQADSERRRLLYVGMTRAREQVIFVRNLKAKINISKQFISSLKDDSDSYLLEFPNDKNQRILISGQEYPCRYEELSYDESTSVELIKSIEKLDLTYGDLSQNKYRRCEFQISPSNFELPEDILKNWRIDEVIKIPAHLEFEEKFDPQLLGDALHQFFTCRLNFKENDRGEVSKQILKNWSLEKIVDTVKLIQYANNFDAVLNEKWPNHKQWHEAHVKTNFSGTRIEGQIDLLIETEDEVLIIDHKTGLFNPKDPIASSKKYIPQLSCYKKMLNEIHKDKKISTWIHWVRNGSLIRLSENQMQ